MYISLGNIHNKILLKSVFHGFFLMFGPFSLLSCFFVWLVGCWFLVFLLVNFSLTTTGVTRENKQRKHDTLFKNKCQSFGTFKSGDYKNHDFSRFANTIMSRFGVAFPLSLSCMANSVVLKCRK